MIDKHIFLFGQTFLFWMGMYWFDLFWSEAQYNDLTCFAAWFDPNDRRMSYYNTRFILLIEHFQALDVSNHNFNHCKIMFCENWIQHYLKI